LLAALQKIGKLHALAGARSARGGWPVGTADVVALDLAGTAVTDAGLAQLKELGKLRELNLSGTLVTAEGLSQLKELTELQRLRLSPTQLSDTALQTLAEIGKLHTLDRARL